MTVDAGAIKYTVEAETGDLLSAEKVVDKTTSAMASDFKKVDTAVDKTGKQLTKTAKSVKTGMASIGRSSGQAGIQLQQFIGQVQGGQSAMLALSQQSADLGIVLGAPLLGAVVGISASLVGLLLPSLLKTSEAAKEFTFNVEDAAESLKDLQDLSKAQVAVAINDTAKSMSELSDESEKVGKRIAKLNQQLDTGRVKSGRGSTRLLNVEESKELQEELNRELAQLDKINKEYKQQSDLLVKLSENKKGISKESEKQEQAIDKLTQSLTAQKIALEDGEEAAFRYATAQQLGLKNAEMLPAAIDEQIAALFRLRDAQKQAADSASAKKQLSGRVQGIGLTPEEQINSRLQTELELLAQAEEQKIEIEGTYQERRVELHKQADERIAALNKKQTEDSIVNYEALENQIIGTFASIASGAQDGREAIRSLAQSILTQMVGALIKMGVQAVIGQTTTAATGAATAATLAASYAPAAALASLASFGANAAPAAAGIASTVGLAQSLSIAGARQFGGPVNGGDAYRVGEAGPEIYTSGGKNYMIPGENGKVIANDDINGGGTVININNMAPGVDVEASTNNEGRIVDIAVRRSVDEMTNQVSTNSGKFMKTLKSTTNVTSRATR